MPPILSILPLLSFAHMTVVIPAAALIVIASPVVQGEAISTTHTVFRPQFFLLFNLYFCFLILDI
jgi:hypothetical protein